MPRTSRAARLHGIRDLRLDQVQIAEPGPGEVLVRIEACGICPTDIRKFDVGLNDGSYPFNPGHEWVGRIEGVGPGVDGHPLGQRVYGDVYGGYADYVLLPVGGNPWSCGPLAVGEDMPLHRAVFVEPLADCLHAVHDQAGVTAGQDVLVVGAGQMGLQLVAVAVRAGARVVAVDPIATRRVLALDFGATLALDPAELVDELGTAAVDAVILSVARAESVSEVLPLLRPGGTVVLFAGFGRAGRAVVDLNDVHYRELSIVGSEWVGTPPNQRLHHYRTARDLLADGGAFALESLVTGTAGFDSIAEAFDSISARRGLKFVLEIQE